MKKTLALGLSAALLVGALAGCGGGKSDAEDEFDGEWRADVDLTDKINEGFANEGLDEYVDVGDVSVEVVLKIHSDNGTYSLTADEDSVSDVLDDLKDVMEDGMRAALEDEGRDLDEFLEERDMTIDELLDRELGTTEEIMEYAKVTGQYRAEGRKLYVSMSLGSAPDERYLSYDLDGNTLTVDDGENLYSDWRDVLPVEFTRS